MIPFKNSMKILSKLLNQDEKPLTVPEAAIYLGISKSYLYQIIFYKKIPYFKPAGGKIYFKKSDLDSYLFRNRIASDREIENEAVNYVAFNK